LIKNTLGINVNWLIIISNTAFGSISTVLFVLGWKTLKTIKYLNVGKLFWIPILLSSVLFAISSLITILNDVFLSLAVAFEIDQIIQLIALCSLSVGVYSYSRTIRRNIPEKYIIPEDIHRQKKENSLYSPLTTSVYREKDSSSNFQKRISSECNYQLGYLGTIPANASLPEECLSCNKVMECKQS
jgi:hypothetical protein